MRRRAVLALLLGLSCGEALRTDGDTLTVVFRDVTVAPLLGMDGTQPVLDGTRLCPELRCDGCAAPVTACYDVAVDGAAGPDDDGCFVAEAPAAMTWRFVPRACDLPDAPGVADQLTLQTVSTADVRPRLSRWADEWALATMSADFPDDLVEPDDAPLRVAVGGTARAQVELVSDRGLVAFDRTAVRPSLTPGAGRAPILADRGDGTIAVTAAEAGSGLLGWVYGDVAWPGVEVIGVPVDQLAAPELVVGMTPTPTGEVPAGARVMLRTRSGDVVHGAPFTWRVTSGALVVDPGRDLPGQDYATLADGCRAPGESGAATLAVAWGDLHDRVALRWDGQGDPADPDACLRGPCGCAQPSRGAGLGGLLVLLAWRRRRLIPLLALSACAPDPVAAVRELGPLMWTPAVAGRDGGYSAQTPAGSVWMFGDSIMRWPGEDGSTWRNNTWCRTVDDDASDGLDGFEEPLDALGVPREFLPMTDAERAFEAEHNGPGCGDDCAGIAMWPGAQVWDADRDRLLVFYALYEQRPGFLNLTARGWGVALWPAGADQPTRPISRPDLPDPTMLFGPDERWTPMASMMEAGALHVVLCGDDRACALARVDPAQVTDPAAWRYWGGAAGWVDDWAQKRPIFHASTIGSLHFNRWLGQYVVFDSDAWGDGIRMRTAPEVTGPWSAPRRVHEAADPVPGAWRYSALAHPELAQQDGRLEYVTDYADWDGSMRLIEVELR